MIPDCGEVKPRYEIGYVCHLETYINVGFCRMFVTVIMDSGANFFPCYNTYVEVGFCKIDIIIIGDNGANFNGMTNVLCNGVNTWKGFFFQLM
jgi:hypothetical protein